MIRVGVTGGIGSGKSTVCRLLEERGVPVYYSDERAREIMNGGGAAGVTVGAAAEATAGATGGCDGDAVRSRITALLGDGAYRAGRLDSAYVAGRVFADRGLLAALDAIVHPAVASDFEAWARSLDDRPYVVIESAVLVESGFDRLVNRVIAVSAHVETRIARVLARGGTGRDDVVRRMENQLSDARREERAWLTLRNDGGVDELAAQVALIDGRLRELAAEQRLCELAESRRPASEPADEA